MARDAAHVASEKGLFTMARLMERSGRLNDAEEHYRRILDQYGWAGTLAGFYYRQARVAKKAEYETRLRSTLALALPAGLEPLDLAQFPAPPTDGVVVRKENDNTKRHDIRWGQVIVGLDGFRVRNKETYDVVEELSQSPHMKLLVWRGKSYEAIDAELWDRKFQVTMEDLKPK